MKEFITNLKLAWQYAKNQKKYIICFAIFNIFSIVISVVVPILGAQIIVTLTSSNFKQLIYVTLLLTGIELLRNIVHYITKYCSQITYRETFTKIQNKLGQEILKLENKSIDTNSSGVFIQRLTSDTSRIADIFNVLNSYLTNIITDIGIFIAIFIVSKVAFIYLIIMVTIIFFFEKKRIKIFIEKDKEYRKRQEKVSGFVAELVRGVRDIKMLNAEKSFMKELDSNVTDLNAKRYEMHKIDRQYSLVRGTLMDISNAGMIFLLIYLIVKNNITIPSAIIIFNYKGRVTSIVKYASKLLNSINDFNLSTTRIFSILDSNEFEKEKFGNKTIQKVKGNIEFNNVNFSYNQEQKILSNISFKVKANETIAFVGKSGAGKTTIFNLICKMYNIDSGKITIDGIDIQELTKNTIRGNITIISQNPYIFNMSIKDNLRLVKENLTDEEMIKACKLACLHDFIKKLPNGYDTIIGEGGISLSGGQRQRLAIARAFVQKTEIILFDEATSALDNETQANIQKAITNLQKSYTILIIAHRLSTIVNSDRIYFINDGTIEASGTHNELLKTNKNYKQLYETEISR